MAAASSASSAGLGALSVLAGRSGLNEFTTIREVGGWRSNNRAAAAMADDNDNDDHEQLAPPPQPPAPARAAPAYQAKHKAAWGVLNSTVQVSLEDLKIYRKFIETVAEKLCKNITDPSSEPYLEWAVPLRKHYMYSLKLQIILNHDPSRASHIRTSFENVCLQVAYNPYQQNAFNDEMLAKRGKATVPADYLKTCDLYRFIEELIYINDQAERNFVFASMNTMNASRQKKLLDAQANQMEIDGQGSRSRSSTASKRGRNISTVSSSPAAVSDAELHTTIRDVSNDPLRICLGLYVGGNAEVPPTWWRPSL